MVQGQTTYAKQAGVEQLAVGLRTLLGETGDAAGPWLSLGSSALPKLGIHRPAAATCTCNELCKQCAKTQRRARAFKERNQSKSLKAS